MREILKSLVDEFFVCFCFNYLQFFKRWSSQLTLAVCVGKRVFLFVCFLVCLFFVVFNVKMRRTLILACRMVASVQACCIRVLFLCFVCFGLHHFNTKGDLTNGEILY